MTSQDRPANSTRGLVDVTRGRPDLRIPADTPKGETWRYGLVLPFQAAPRLAAAYVNIRVRNGVMMADDPGGDDFEVGVDLALFDQTRAYLEEVRSAGTPVAAWRF